MKAKALILEGAPTTVPFAQLAQIYSEVFFDQAELCPRLYLNFDFPAMTGQLVETHYSQRWATVGAFCDGRRVRAMRRGRRTRNTARAQPSDDLGRKPSEPLEGSVPS